MKRTSINNELGQKEYIYKGSSVTRGSVNGIDYCFVPGEKYRLQNDEHFKSLIDQGFFELVVESENLNP